MKYFLGLLQIFFLGIKDITTKELTVSLKCDSSTHRGGNINFTAEVHGKYTSDYLCKNYRYREEEKFYIEGELHRVTCRASFRYKFRDNPANHQHSHDDINFHRDRTKRTVKFDYPKKDYEAANYTAEAEVDMRVDYAVTYRITYIKSYLDAFGYKYTKVEYKWPWLYFDQVFELKPKPALTSFILTERTWRVKWDRSLPFINPPIFITIFLSIFFGLHIMVHF